MSVTCSDSSTHVCHSAIVTDSTLLSVCHIAIATSNSNPSVCPIAIATVCYRYVTDAICNDNNSSTQVWDGNSEIGLMPKVDGVLRDIARWKYIIVTDLRQSFYQIPLEHGPMRFCGVVTPFKGIRVYTLSAMGMPGSETCLEEFMSRVLGEFIMQGWVAKIADDHYIGGNDPEEALSHCTSVLKALRKNNLGLNASKTVIFPLQTTFLGWIWSSGKLRASPHRLAALSQVQPPSTVQGLHSFIGAYKSFSRVLPGYAKLLDPLDQATAGKQSRDKLVWNDSMLLAFEDAQKALNYRARKSQCLSQMTPCISWLMHLSKKRALQLPVHPSWGKNLHCGVLQCKVEETSAGMAAMWAWGSKYWCSCETFCTIHNPVQAPSSSTDGQQTLCAGP